MSVIPGSTATSRRDLTVLGLVAAAAMLVVVLYRESFASMAALWQYTDYRHGVIVFPISAYLLWRARRALAAVELNPCPWSLAIVAGLVMLWLLARSIGVQAIEHLAAALLIPATVLAFLGWPLMRQAMFPLLFLAASVPVGEALVPHLMQITADVSSGLLRLTGVPVFRQGQFLSLPGGEFEVADVCAGLRYLIAGTMIALLFSYLTYQSNAKRSLFVAAMAATMIIANGIRAFVVMYVASATDMRYFAGRDHIYFGWLLFGVVVVGLIYLGSRYADAERVPIRGEDASVGHRSERGPPWALMLVLGFLMLAATAQPLQRDLGNNALLLWPAGGLLLWVLYRRFGPVAVDTFGAPRVGGAYRRLGGVAVLVAAPLVLAGGPALLSGRADALPVSPSDAPLPRIAQCGAPGEWVAGWQPVLGSPDIAVSASYYCGDRPVNAYLAAYLGSDQGREAGSFGNGVVPVAWRRFAVADEHAFADGRGGAIRVNEVRLDAPGRRALIWYWFSAGGRTATTPTMAKLNQAVQWLVTGRTDGSGYLLETPVEDSVDASRERLTLVAREIGRLSLVGRMGARE